MNRKISKKTIYILAGALLFVVIMTISGTRIHFRWAGEQYFGEIVEVKDGTLLMRTDEAQKLLVLMDTNTSLRKGRVVWADPLRVGDFVIVVGSPHEDGSITAKLIRLIDSPRSQQ